MTSRGPESTYAQYPYTPPKSQHSLHTLHHHQYTQSQFTSPQESIIAPTPSGTPNPQYTTSQSTSIVQGSQTRRYKVPQLTTSIAPRQYPSTAHPSIAPPINEHSPSPTQCLPTTNTISSTSLPASLPTPPTVPAGLSSPNGTAAASSFDLQEIIAQFGGQPELLKLILTSKVEEDKRKAAEAKLRAKQLDLMLCDKHRKCIDHDGKDDIHSNQDMDYENDHSIGQYSTDGQLNYASFNNTTLSSPVQSLSLNSPSSTPVSQSTPRLKSRINPTSKDQEEPAENEQNINCTPNKRKRKRREMLPVTMIVETKECPHVDDYLWKNNGNTTQRKTGNKSVYFKCSNSNKGCPVNKTVTEKDCGYLIKYRGHHLDECGKIKRIVQP